MYLPKKELDIQIVVAGALPGTLRQNERYGASIEHRAAPLVPWVAALEIELLNSQCSLCSVNRATRTNS